MKYFIVTILFFQLTCSFFQTKEPVVCDSSVNHDVYRLLNKIREKNKVPELLTDKGLERAASVRANYIYSSGKIDHIDSKGQGPMQRLKKYGIVRTLVGENVAIADRSIANYILNQWVEGSSEYRNMIHENMVRTGVSVQGNGDSCAIVVLFTN